MEKEKFVALGISEDLAEKAAEAVKEAYKDYVQCGEAQTITGTLRLDSNIPHSCLAVGHTAFDGWIDEMRITQGILPVSQMLHAQKRGTVVIFR